MDRVRAQHDELAGLTTTDVSFRTLPSHTLRPAWASSSERSMWPGSTRPTSRRKAGPCRSSARWASSCATTRSKGAAGGTRTRSPRPRTPRTARVRPDVAMAGAMTCDRDRALLLCYVSSGTRASELLGVAIGDVDWAGARPVCDLGGHSAAPGGPGVAESHPVPDPLPRRRRRARPGRAAGADPPRRDTSCDLLGHAARGGVRRAGSLPRQLWAPFGLHLLALIRELRKGFVERRRFAILKSPHT